MNDCLSSDDLKAIAQGSITEADQPIAVSHLGNCKRCQTNLDEITDAISLEEELRTLSPTLSSEIANSEFLTHVIEQLTESRRDEQQGTKPKFDLEPLLEPDPTGNAQLGLFGTYEVIELAGQGGMGVVLKARDPKLDRVVAIKLISEPNADLRQRFLREAQSAAALVHENIVTVHSADELNGRPYIVMQYVDGQSLSELIKEKNVLSVDQIVEIARQISAGLAAAHRRGLIHRDIKPENILIEAETGRALLSDFGLVKQIPANGSQHSNDNLTQPGLIVGTPRYMAPEHANDQPADVRSDLFSLGSVLYSMCTGKAAFGGDSTLQILMQVCEQTPEPIRKINPDIPTALSSIVEKLHKKNPADRFQSAEELLAALGKLDESGQSVRQNTSRTSTLPWLMVACSLGAIGLFLYSSGFFSVASEPSVSESKNNAPTEFHLVSNGAHFESLSEAIEQAQPEDVIEVHGTAPHLIQQVTIESDQVVTIRGVAGAKLTCVDPKPMMIVKGSCKLQNIQLRHQVQGGIRQAFARQELQQWKNESVLAVDLNGSLFIEHCKLDCAPKRIGILHTGKSVDIHSSEILAPSGIAIGWQGKEKTTLKLESSHVESIMGVAYQFTSGEPTFEMRHCNWVARPASSKKQMSRLLRIDQDSSNENPLEIELLNNFIVGEVLIALRGRKSADFMDISESGNVFAVESLIMNRSRKATNLSEWKMLIGSNATTSVLVPRITIPEKIQHKDIDWGDDSPRKDFGAPENIGPKN